MAAGERPDVTLLDAPVSGSKDPAERGQLTIFASGPAVARSPVAPLFDALRPAHDLGRRVRCRNAAEAGGQHLVRVHDRGASHIGSTCPAARPRDRASYL